MQKFLKLTLESSKPVCIRVDKIVSICEYPVSMAMRQTVNEKSLHTTIRCEMNDEAVFINVQEPIEEILKYIEVVNEN